MVLRVEYPMCVESVYFYVFALCVCLLLEKDSVKLQLCPCCSARSVIGKPVIAIKKTVKLIKLTRWLAAARRFKLNGIYLGMCGQSTLQRVT